MTAHPPRTFRRRRARALGALATLALSVSAMAGTAAASPGSGEVELALKTKGKSSLPAQGVQVTYTAKAGKTGATKRIARPQGKGGGEQVVLPVNDVELRQTATVKTGGMLSLSADGAKTQLTGVVLQMGKSTTAISAKLGKKRLVIFRAEGASKIDDSSVSLKKASLSLTGQAASALRNRLGLETLTAGKTGTANVEAKLKESPSTQRPADTNNKQQSVTPEPCPLPVTSTVTGSAAAPAAAPTLDSPSDITGGKIDWAFSSSLQGYVLGFNGTLEPTDGATLPTPPTGSFRFPNDAGEYAINDPTNGADDQAIINGEGEVRFCHFPHKFAITLSNPTVTINGGSSRLTVDVDTNMSGVHTPTQRVDLATLNLSTARPFYSENGKSVTWSELPVTLTAAGEQALQLCDPHIPGPCGYAAGSSLDPLTVEVKTGAGVQWPFKSSCNLTQLMPKATWPAAPGALQTAPILTSPQSITEGSINWGLRNSLRRTVQVGPPPGVFNLSGGATRSDGANMEGAGKFFTWPVSTGQYEAGTPGRLILAGTGAVGLCQTGHGFGTVLSNPTIVIDGTNSRITMDIASRVGQFWTSGRVDVATLEIGKVERQVQADTPTVGKETITWTFPDLGADNAPGGTGTNADDQDSASSTVKMTTAGGVAFSLIGLKAGTSLNKLTVSIVR